MIFKNFLIKPIHSKRMDHQIRIASVQKHSHLLKSTFSRIVFLFRFNSKMYIFKNCVLCSVLIPKSTWLVFKTVSNRCRLSAKIWTEICFVSLIILSAKIWTIEIFVSWIILSAKIWIDNWFPQKWNQLPGVEDVYKAQSLACRPCQIDFRIKSN